MTQSFAAGLEQITNYAWTTTGHKINGWKRLVFQTDGTIEVQCHPGDVEHGKWKEYSQGKIEVNVNGDEYLSHAFLWFSGDPASGYTRLDLWSDRGNIGGDGRRQESVGNAAASQPPPGAPAEPTVPWIADFAAQSSKAIGWATLPLTNTVPAAVRDNMADLREGLKNEAAFTPQASAQAYKLADILCGMVIGTLDERENTLAQNRQNAGGKLTDSWTSAWASRCLMVRNSGRAMLEQFGAAVRQSEKPKLPVPAGMVASVSLPPVPEAAAAQANTFKADPNNPLNRGAYDRHSAIWAPWWGSYRYYR